MLRYPFNGDPICTNEFRDGRFSNPHYGEDYAMPHRTAIIAQTSGKVVEIQNSESRNWLANTSNDPYKPVGWPVIRRRLRTEDYGNYVKMYHGQKDGKDVHILNSHLDEVVVFLGQYVEKGEIIGYSDNTGNSTGNHLHTEIRLNNRVVNPAVFDMEWEGNLPNDTKEFFNIEKEVTVSKWADGGLNVRKLPRVDSALVKQPRGNLKPGDTFMAVGFVKGENVAYSINDKMIETDIWWVSHKGNYVWSGGTTLIPSERDVPESVLPSNNFKPGELTMNELKAKLAELEAGREAVEVEIKEKESARDEFTLEIAKVKEEMAAAPVEEVVEEVVEEAPEAPVAEEIVEEAPAAPAEDVEAVKKDYIAAVSAAQAIAEKLKEMGVEL